MDTGFRNSSSGVDVLFSIGTMKKNTSYSVCSSYINYIKDSSVTCIYVCTLFTYFLSILCAVNVYSYIIEKEITFPHPVGSRNVSSGSEYDSGSVNIPRKNPGLEKV